MTNHRYTQVIVPMDKYVKSLSPRERAWLTLLEASLLLVLFASMFFYVD